MTLVLRRIRRVVDRGMRRSMPATAAVCASGAALMIAAASALAVTPKPGCWGTCGGDEGPVRGYFFVSHHTLEDGVKAEFKCLGTQKVKFINGQSVTVGDPLTVPYPRSNGLPPALKVSKGGHFSFRGNGEWSNGKKSRKVRVDLSGEFVSRTKARLTFHISYGKCGTQHLTVIAD